MKALEYLKKEREIKKHCADVTWGYYDKDIDEAIKELEEYESDMDSYLDYTTGSRCTKSFNSCLGSIKIAYGKELEKLVKENSEDRLAELEGKKINNLIESIKTTSEYSKYIQAKKDLKDVLKGGKDYHSCSFMDISIRDDRFEARKKELIEYIGIFILNKIEEVNG